MLTLPVNDAEPVESMRSLSAPAVSAVIVSLEGNLILVFVSPL